MPYSDSDADAIQVGEFDRVEATEDPARYVEWMQRQRGIADSAIGELGLTGTNAVLDIGCGPGADLPVLAGCARLTIGVDLAETMTTAARIRVPTAKVVVADARRLPFAPDSFDAAWVRAVLIHTPDPQAVMDEIARLLRRGARVVLSEPDHGSHVVATDYPAIFERIKEHTTHRRTMFRNPCVGRDLAAMASAAGLTVARVWITPILYTSFETARSAGGPFDRAVADAVAEGAVSANDGRLYLASLQDRDRDGSFFFAALSVRVLASAL